MDAVTAENRSQSRAGPLSSLRHSDAVLAHGYPPPLRTPPVLVETLPSGHFCAGRACLPGQRPGGTQEHMHSTCTAHACTHLGRSRLRRRGRLAHHAPHVAGAGAGGGRRAPRRPALLPPPPPAQQPCCMRCACHMPCCRLWLAAAAHGTGSPSRALSIMTAFTCFCKGLDLWACGFGGMFARPGLHGKGWHARLTARSRAAGWRRGAARRPRRGCRSGRAPWRGARSGGAA